MPHWLVKPELVSASTTDTRGPGLAHIYLGVSTMVDEATKVDVLCVPTSITRGQYPVGYIQMEAEPEGRAQFGRVNS
jgi:hypothetical protein